MSEDSQRQKLRAIGVELFDRWTALWNGDVALAEHIMAPAFRLRYSQANTERVDSVRTPAALADLVKFWHTFRPGIRFTAEADAVVDLELVGGLAAGRIARPYLAVFTDAAGQVVARSGIDMFAVEAGRIVEVWSVSSGAAGRTFYELPPASRR